MTPSNGIASADQRASVDKPPRWEWIVVIGILLIAAAFRLFALNDVPPGLHHDEVIIGQVAKDILRGHLAIYFTAGYGHEPMYHYIAAGMFAFIGANAFVLRLTSAFIALLGLAITYRFVRNILSPTIAIGALAWMAVSLWPIFFSRVGLRGILLPALTVLTAHFVWKAFMEQGARSRGQGIKQVLLSGVLLGLTLYTYQASRVFPIVFGVWFIYLFVRHRFSSLIPHPSSLIPHPSSLVAFFAAALIVAAPLIVYLTIINPTAEQRISELSGPINQLREGDPHEVIQSTLNTLGMFTMRGDAVPIYNVADRPVFPEPIGAALFYLGLLISLWRWKQPAYALMLIWFFISLVPAMVTPFSPNFVRTIAVWPVPFVFAGVAMHEIIQRVSDKASQRVGESADHPVILSPRHLVIGLFGIILIANGLLTARDYFVDWPRGDYVRFWQQATWTQAVRYLNADPSNLPVAASGLSINDFDPQTFDLLGVRSDLKVKWFDCRNAILFPGMIHVTRYLSPDFFPCDADLWKHYLSGAQLIAQPRWPDSGNVIFSLYEFNPYQLYVGSIRDLINERVFIGGESFDANSPETGLEQAGYLDFSGLNFFGREIDQATTKPGDAIEIETYWRVTALLSPPLKIFVHVTSPDGKIVAQWDGLDVDAGSLEPYDLFVQRHRIDLPPDLAPGPYRISLGVYHADTGARLKARIDDRDIDSIVLGTLMVEK